MQDDNIIQMVTIKKGEQIGLILAPEFVDVADIYSLLLGSIKIVSEKTRISVPQTLNILMEGYLRDKISRGEDK